MVNNLEIIHKAKRIVDTLDTNYFDLTVLNERTDIDISIVMTTYNRSVQTYFTLKTIANSSCKNVQVIIVDDSTTDTLNMDTLQGYGVCTYHIKTKNKFWFNPCVNYNLGFKFIKGSKVIIQNAEVCHVGDVISYVDKELKENDYLVFDVATTPNLEINGLLHQMEMTFDNYANISSLFNGWYQHHITYNRCLHFLSAITKKTFDKINGFDYDFSMGSWYDDNEFLFRIKAVGINVIAVPLDKQIQGIHQWHPISGYDWDKGMIKNDGLIDAKVTYFHKHAKLFYSTDYPLDEAYDKLIELFA